MKVRNASKSPLVLMSNEVVPIEGEATLSEADKDNAEINRWIKEGMLVKVGVKPKSSDSGK